MSRDSDNSFVAAPQRFHNHNSNTLFCRRHFCSGVKLTKLLLKSLTCNMLVHLHQVTGWMHQLTGTCEPAAIIHYEKPTQSATAALWPCNWPSEGVGGSIQNSIVQFRCKCIRSKIQNRRVCAARALLVTYERAVV